MFKRLFVFLISLIVLLSGCSQSSDGDQSQTEVSVDIVWVDFVKLDGIQYLRTNYSIDTEKLGSQINEVKFNVANNVNDTNYIVKDGDATYLEEGTPIYNIKDYNSNFRIAIKSADNIIVYQVFDNPSAKIGSDIVDIFNKVEYIGINNETNDKELVVIRDTKKINEMVDMLIKAPVDISTSKQTGEKYLISFHLKDKSEFKGLYCLESGQFSNVYFRFVLPVDFKTMVEEVLKSNS